MSYVRKTIGFDDKWLMLIGIPVIAFIMNVIMFPGIFKKDFSIFFNHCFTVGVIYTVVYWFLFRYATSYLINQYPKQSETWKRILLQIGLVVIGFVIVNTLVGALVKAIFDLSEFIEPPLILKSFGSFLCIFLVWSIYESIYFYTKLQKSIREKDILQKENIQSQLEGLKNQVNPHFLFNSLNTLTYLIPEDPDKAINFVQQLSKVYRYILEIKDKKIIKIEEELQFLNSYVFLLKERFGDNLQIEIDIPKENYRKKIVPLSLQILFENVIKHNIISTQKPLEIKVSVEKDKLIVKNNLQKKNHVASSTRMGLQNIKNRYQFFTDQEVDVIVTQNSFLVALPIVEQFSIESQSEQKSEII